MTKFEAALDDFLSLVAVGVPQGVLLEIDSFLPEGWGSSVQDGVHVVTGRSGIRWAFHVQKLIRLLAYSEGSLVRRVSPEEWEFFTWRNEHGDGFKVVFLAVPE